MQYDDVTTDGRHLQNGFIAIYQPCIIRFQWNLVCRCKFLFEQWSYDILKIVLALSQQIIVQLMPNLVWRSRLNHTQRSHTQKSTFQKFKMADSHHVKNSLLLYPSCGLHNFNEICFADANFGSQQQSLDKRSRWPYLPYWICKIL